MAKRSNVRISVVKKLGVKELWGDEAPKRRTSDICPIFNVGDIYLTEGLRMPEGWPCSWAWHDIFKEVMHLALGGEFYAEPGNLIYACCTDGLKPVFFKIQREE